MMTGNTAIHIASQLQSGAPRKAAFLVAVLSIELVAMINSESQHVHGQLDLLRKDLFDILKRGAIDGDDVLRGNVSFNKGTRDACNKLGGAGIPSSRC